MQRATVMALGQFPVAFGVGSPGTNGFVPRMVATESPAIWNAGFTLAVDRANGGRDGILVISSVPELFGTPFQGARLYVALSNVTALVRVGPLAGTGPGNGFGSATVPIPSIPALIGTSVFAQWFVFEPALPVVAAGSRGAELRLF